VGITRVGLFATVLLAAGLSIRAAYAIPVHVDVGYTIDTSFGGFPGLANVALSLDYDTDAPATSPTFYPLSAAGTINGTPLAILSSFINIVNDVPFTPPRDRVQFNAEVNQAFGGVTLQNLGLVLEGPATLFAAGAGPFVLDPEDFTIKEAYIVWQSGSNLFADYDFSPTITVSVPEPSTLLLISAGLLGVGLARRRRPLNA
jgi:PEP-CTERM motif